MDIQVVENVTKINDEVALLNRNELRRRGILTLDIMGAPGCGKTTLIEALLPRLEGVRVAVINGDLATARDAQRVAKLAPHVVQINTGKTCHLEAHHVRNALGRLPLDEIDLLIIENVGNLICPVGFDLGQDVKIGVFSITGGDDKAAKHPGIVAAADLLILTGIDLAPHMNFDRELFRADIRRLNPSTACLELSGRTGEGMQALLDWIAARRKAR
jgi:hydrogenase nickel incorporation protein HypB